MEVYNKEKQIEGFTGWWNSDKITKWDDKYDNYDVHTMRYLNSRQKKLLELVDTLKLPQGAKVLELGYGAGQTALKLVQRGFEVHGVDISSKLCELAKQRCQHECPEGKFNFTVGNIEERLKYDNGSFDLVVIVGALQYLYDYNACLKEAHRVLKPNGYFALAQFNSYSISYFLSLRGICRTLTYFVLREKLEIFPSFKSILTNSKLRVFFKKYKDSKFMNSKFMLKGHNVYKYELKKKAITYCRLKRIIKDNHFKPIKSKGAYYPFSEKKSFWDFNIKYDQFIDKYLSWLLFPFARSAVFLSRKEDVQG